MTGHAAARAGSVVVVLVLLLAGVAAAEPLTLRTRARSWDVSGKRVDRAGRERVRSPDALASFRFGPNGDVDAGRVEVALSGGGGDLVLDGPFDPDAGARHDIDLETGSLRDAVLAMAAATQPDDWDPADKDVTFRRAQVKTRGKWKDRVRGRRKKTFLGLTEILRVRVKIVAKVTDPGDSRARPIRVKTTFRGTFERYLASLGEPGTGPAPDADCPWSDALDGRAVVRDPEQRPPSPVEDETLEGQDADLLPELMQAPLVGTYDAALRLILSRAGIGDVPFCVLSDFRAAGPLIRNFGGGFANHELLFLDGKLLDILAEYARYRVLAEDGEVPVDDDGALNAIVNRHNQHPGAAPDGFFHLASALTQEQAERARGHFTRSIAPIVYHEFGHHFLWAALDDLRARAGQLTQDYLTTSLHEDDADRVAGALVRKSGGTAQDIELLYDTLALYIAWRAGEVTTIEQVRSSDFQDASASPRYATPAERKAIANGILLCD